MKAYAARRDRVSLVISSAKPSKNAIETVENLIH